MDSYDVVLIGAGPGGYVAAIRAAQLGLKTALAEREAIGGVCLNWGCIPTKALLRNAEIVTLFRRAHEFGISFDNLQIDFSTALSRSQQAVNRLVKGVQFLLKKNGIAVLEGDARILAPDRVVVGTDGTVVEARHVIIATGARPKSLPGLKFHGTQVLDSRRALELDPMPASIVIIGGGAVGVEFGYFYNAYGSQVTLVEMMPQLLPAEDEEVARELEKALTKQGITVMVGTKFESLQRTSKGVLVTVVGPDGPRGVEADAVLVAVGVQGNVEGLGLEELGVAVERGFISIDDRMATNVPGIYAIGDVTGKMLLAHAASAQGEIAVEAIAGREVRRLVYENIPRAVYCQPQVASVGLTAAQAQERGYKVKVGQFPFRANGKALALGEYEGFVKIVADGEYGEILGAQMIGSDVTELLPELTLARTLEATAKDVAASVHAHPTLSEALREAMLAVSGEAIHI